MNKIAMKLHICVIVLAMIFSTFVSLDIVYSATNEDGDVATLPVVSENTNGAGDLQLPTTAKVPENTTIANADKDNKPLVGDKTTANKTENYTSVNNKTTANKKDNNVVNKAKKLKTKVISATKKNKKAKNAKIVLKKIKNASGYQIKYSTNKKFKKFKKKSFKKNKFKLKKLKPGKKYYVKARTYVKTNGKKTYGLWSKAKRVKVKN